MKKLLILLVMLTVGFVAAQQKNVKYEVESEDLVKVIYYYEDGTVKEEGFFKNKKLEGKWSKYDSQGKKIVEVHYKEGIKVGTWFYWNDTSLKQVNYKDNTIASVNVWKEDSKLASNDR